MDEMKNLTECEQLLKLTVSCFDSMKKGFDEAKEMAEDLAKKCRQNREYKQAYVYKQFAQLVSEFDHNKQDLERIKNSNNTSHEEGFLKGVESVYSDSFKDFMKRLKNQVFNEEIENPEAKNGIWKNEHNNYETHYITVYRATCSVCGKTSETISDYGMLFEYCPECGAKMSGGSLYYWHKYMVD